MFKEKPLLQALLRNVQKHCKSPHVEVEVHPANS
jgi:hypothetical protein